MAVSGTHWISLEQRDDGLSLSRTMRLKYLLDDEPRQPVSCLILGGESRLQVAKHVARSFEPIGRADSINLRLKKQSSPPILIADGPISLESVQGRSTTGAVAKFPVNDPAMSLPNLYTRLLAPLVDMVAFHVSSIVDLEVAAAFIARWICAAGGCTHAARPQFIVLLEGDSLLGSEARFTWLLGQKTAASVFSVFSDISFLPLGPDCVEAGDTLSAAILTKSRAAPGSMNRVRYSNAQLCALFESAFTNLIQGMSFNCVQAARSTNPIPENAANCLSRFLRANIGSRNLRSTVLPMVASCILLDAFPPEMPGERLCSLLGLMS